MNHIDANDMFSAGAELIQVFSGFVYRGPKLVRELSPYLRFGRRTSND
jgi:dihydroorotate dehydrogenase